ncbi:unnamed protein product [Prunus armeniaca]|uniref:Uncharacterized protein n=1 Tax=Prunus armeniaca TaxID=36596 RepID=A0A6J5WH40_PRUAR|nr:unnamed protein product [Prunus armeniaca]
MHEEERAGGELRNQGKYRCRGDADLVVWGKMKGNRRGKEKKKREEGGVKKHKRNKGGEVMRKVIGEKRHKGQKKGGEREVQ